MNVNFEFKIKAIIAPIKNPKDPEKKTLLENKITNLENLTNNMKIVFDKYFSKYGGKKSRKNRKRQKKKYTNKKKLKREKNILSIVLYQNTTK